MWFCLWFALSSIYSFNLIPASDSRTTWLYLINWKAKPHVRNHNFLICDLLLASSLSSYNQFFTSRCVQIRYNNPSTTKSQAIENERSKCDLSVWIYTTKTLGVNRNLQMSEAKNVCNSAYHRFPIIKITLVYPWLDNEVANLKFSDLERSSISQKRGNFFVVRIHMLCNSWIKS